MTNIEYITAYITLINIILFEIFMLFAIVIIVKEIKHNIKLNQKKHKST